MVKGFEIFQKAFEGYEDYYTIIGGTACDILMSEAGLNFRATKDIDMILLFEDKENFDDFGTVFWQFIKDGGYRCGWKNSDKLHFCRFTEPQNLQYPYMIELFSRMPNSIKYKGELKLVPLHISDEVSSLSAILLNEDYYNLMKKGRKVLNGIGILEAKYLIPSKVRAWIDLTNRKKAGEHVNSNDIKKHKNDVFRLFNLISIQDRVISHNNIKEDMKEFIDFMYGQNVVPDNFGLNMTLDEVLDALKEIYLQE